ncbi:MAG: hypothetical protein WCA23_12930 [Stellaceae bacterium]
MRRLEIDQPARGRRPHFRFRVLFSQAVEFRLQDFPHTILEERSLGRKPLVEGRCDPVEIFEKALAIGLEEIVGFASRVSARLEDCERIDPALPEIDPDTVAIDLDEAGDVPVDHAVELRQRLPQAHSGLRIGRTIPQQTDQTTSRDTLALREAQAGQQPACFSSTRQKVGAAGRDRPHGPDHINSR